MKNKHDPMDISAFASEIDIYLASKLPDLPEHTRLEIAAYIGYKATYLVVDTINAVNHEWTASMRSSKLPRYEAK